MITAWHFRASGDRLRDGSQSHAGAVDNYHGSLELCARGLHASRRLIDALHYAPGPWLARVECDGDIVVGEDKLACSRRKVLWIRDVSVELRDFARWCARSVLHLWQGVVPPAVIQWLDTGDVDVRDAARGAACAARSAADSSACAARSAADSAARSTARDAVCDAARCAAESAAESEGWGAVASVIGSAAESEGWGETEITAWATAWRAACAEQLVKLEGML